MVDIRSKVVDLQQYRESIRYSDHETIEDDGMLYQCGVEGEDINADLKFITDEIWKLFYIYTEEEKLPDSFFLLSEILWLSICELEDPKNKNLRTFNKIKQMMKVDDIRKEMEI